MNYAGIVLNQLLAFVFYALAGVTAVKMKVLDEKGLNYISSYIVRIAMPIMILQKISSMESIQLVISRLPVVILCAVMFVGNYLIAFILKKVFRLKGDKGDVYQATTTFGNMGFMGIPVLTALFPENGMLYISLCTLIDQTAFWTIGVELTTPQSKKGEKKKGFDPGVLKRVFNFGFIAMLIAFVMLIFGIRLPSFIDTAFAGIGNTVSPLALVYLGGVFCYADIKGSFKHLEYYAAIVFRMVVFPILLYMLMGIVPWLDPEIRITMAILCAMPAMTSVSIMAKANGSEGDYSACQGFLTTLFSVVTLPLVVYIVTTLL